ncbi:hypothetical protein [Pseudorhizobium flavum]|uniref:Uncharacterized protein n=1 Tax=Pseudorhizobium flavum TaxID=1335061 RepID=A0A7W9YUV0_9HYPH|nr:hypothetical protein [Pseudorhizobium flavum]MBB6178827.1 hypothetical protein [Pseudorhizobium flavum]CAD6607487.1 hypothetical protein RFYW14_02026 [Pseudorhizobium flavum]
MSSDLHRYTLSRNLVRISGCGYRENIATGRSDASSSAASVIFPRIRMAIAGRRALSVPLSIRMLVAPASLPAPTAV